MDAFHTARKLGVHETAYSWELQKAFVEYLEDGWKQPDSGIWEVRGRRRQFTHSKVMAWVGVDRAVKAIERFGLEGPADRWRALRERIHTEVCERGYSLHLNTFTQYYGSNTVDAALLMIPLVGFLPASDPRMRGTVEAIERELLENGVVRRYRPQMSVEGVPGSEGAFLPCSFWLADNYAMRGERDRAATLFEHLLSLRNDVGLLSEEFDIATGRHLGNFPQAFTHVALVNTAYNLIAAEPGPAELRAAAD
jgi:GH15 family glucan-1,4-alpha-glucosidase